MKLIIEIDMDNEAFEYDPVLEVQSIIEEYLRGCNCEGEIMDQILQDCNGNTVGEARVE